MTEHTPRAALYSAMAKAFPAIDAAVKDSSNPHFKNKYADLSSVVSAIKPALAPHGLWFRQVTHREAGGVTVETLICHASGEEVSGGLYFVPASKNDAQGYGSATTYARRYSLQTAFGVPSDDDDGNAAAKARSQAANAPPTAPVETVSPGQVKALQAALGNAGDDAVPKFCEVMQIDALPDLPASEYRGAMERIAARVAKMQQKVAA